MYYHLYYPFFGLLKSTLALLKTPLNTLCGSFNGHTESPKTRALGCIFSKVSKDPRQRERRENLKKEVNFIS